jgi:dTDP-4-amino-4,6-dideoxygalactose transaminase
MSTPASKVLAVLGGPPAFPEPLHVGRPNVAAGEAFLQRARDVMERRWFTNNGPLVQEFERRIAEITGARHCIALANATAALELTVDALGLSGEVIVPSFTFVATAAALVRRGVRPVFCDVDPRTHQLDPSVVEGLITSRTSAILGVHVWGTPCHVNELSAIADRHHLRLMFDAAHAFGSAYPDGMVGSRGAAEIFSFHATKFVHSAEGGAVTTNDDELAKRLRLLRNFGFTGLDQVECVGTNAKLSELHAAMGLTSLDALPELLRVNLENYHAYRHILAELPGLRLFAIPDGAQHNRQYVVVEVDSRTAPLSRDDLAAVLWAENVLTRRYFYPGIHRIPAFAPYVTPGISLPHTDQLCQSVLQFPTGTAVSASMIRQIGTILCQAWAEAGEVRLRLKRNGSEQPKR